MSQFHKPPASPLPATPLSARPLPADFVASLDAILPLGERKLLVEALTMSAPPTSIRLNPYKIASPPPGEPVPWCRYGRYLPERPLFTLDPSFHAGAYYVQEASSMFLEHIVRELLGDPAPATPANQASQAAQTASRPHTNPGTPAAPLTRNLPAGLRILDLCASPGGKTTLLSTLAGLDGLVVANEPVRGRVGALIDNVRAWGLGNTLVTTTDPSAFGAVPHFFDLLVVDAPCSGEGMLRKDPEAAAQWSLANVTLCAGRQKRILAEAWDALKPGGILVYSTCTFNPAENEEIAAWLHENYHCQGVDIPLDPAWGVVRTETQGIPTFHFYPHKAKGEGFTVTVLQKAEGKSKHTKIAFSTPARSERSMHSGKFASDSPAYGGRPSQPGKSASRSPFSPISRKEVDALRSWVDQPDEMRFECINRTFYGYYSRMAPDVKFLSERLPAVYSGVAMGELFNYKLRPDHALALFSGLERDPARSLFSVAELTEQQVLQYLRMETLDPALFSEGINLVACNDLPLGWIKRIGHRTNTLLPQALRIRM